MQCTSYTPVYYHARDLNVGGSGYAWHLYDSNASFGEERSYNVSMPTCDQYLGYDKEVLKQIIQNHEATFRFQVQELHRLYRRQTDLMDEMRVRELFGQHLLSRTSESIHSSSRAGDGFSQKHSPSTNWLLSNLSFSKLSEPTNAPGPKSFVAENFQKPTTPQTDLLIRRNSEYDVQFLSPSNKQNGNRVVDLDFAADTYYEDQMKTCCNISKFKPASHSDISSNKTWELSSFTSVLGKAKCFIDLNEPIQLESLSGPLEAVTGHSETVSNDEGVPVEATPESKAPRHDLKHGESSDGMNSSMTIDLNSMPVNWYPETEMTIGSTPSVNTEAKVVMDCIFASNHAMRNRKCSEDDKVIVHNDISDSSLKTESFIDLNSSVEDEHSLTPSSSSLQIKSAEFTELKGPLSPENEEHSPPRGKSEDIQLETPLSEQGDGEPFIELETTAAQTLVTIFSSRAHECSGVAVLESLADFRNLCWFAEIVSSTGDELENAVMKLDSDSAENDQGEENTLNSIHLNKGKGTGNMPRRSGKGQKRGKNQRKDLKTDVSEDVHFVEGFLEKGPLKRKAGRNGCAKPRKCSKLSPSDVTKKSMTSILKQSAGSSDQGAVQNWGKTRKREGGRKCSSTIKFFLIR